MNNEVEKNNQYLPEDQDLLKELESIGPLSTGQPLEEQKRRIQIVQIKALLKSRKSSRDNEISNKHYSGIILLFAAVQVIAAMLQMLMFSLDTDKAIVRWSGLLSLLVCAGIMGYFLHEIKKYNKSNK